MIKRLLLLTSISSLVLQSVHSQDLHYADVSTMNLWYNQSLKLDREKDIRLNFRDIKYQSLLAFRTGSGMLNIPFVRKSVSESSVEKGFLSGTVAGAFDRSNRGVFKHSTGLLGLSYSQRLSEDNTYLSLGFQGTMTRSVYGTTGMLFPDQFDQFGPLPRGTQDPLRVGRSYGWMSLNAGLSVYQNTEYKEWYIGGSLRHINRPFTDEQKTSQYRLPATLGMQMGLTVKSETDRIGIYGIANWKAEAYEYLLGARFMRKIDGGEGGTSFGGGVAIRLRDAIIPNLQLEMGKTTVGFHYDMNISGLKASGYSRQGMELSLKRRL